MARATSVMQSLRPEIVLEEDLIVVTAGYILGQNDNSSPPPRKKLQEAAH